MPLRAGGKGCSEPHVQDSERARCPALICPCRSSSKLVLGERGILPSDAGLAGAAGAVRRVNPLTGPAGRVGIYETGSNNFCGAKIIRILIAFVTAGTGHRRAAEAVAEAARQRLPQAEVFCVDLLTYAPSWLRWIYPRLYACLVRYLPWCWELVYKLLDDPGIFRLIQPWRRRWNVVMARRFISWVEGLAPDVAVATHFFPADVLDTAYRAGKLRSRLIVTITDLFPHRFWLVPKASAFVLGSPQTKALCQHRGVEEGRLHVLGIPVGAKFGEPADRAQLASQLGLDPSRRTMLIASGGMGAGPIGELVRRFLALETTRPQQAQLLVVCGQNKKLERRLARLCATSTTPMRVFGFVQTMYDLMRVSDLLVTKAGGLTVMEALSVGLPMIFCGTIPGQERLNAEYVIQHAAGVNAREPSAVTNIVLGLLDDPTQLEAMRAHAHSLGRPRAAQELVERLIIPHARRAD